MHCSLAYLQKFDHPAAHREYKWDLRQASKLSEFTQYLPTAEDKEVVEHYLRIFEENKPKLDRQRRSIIHGDANECNVLVDGQKAAGKTEEMNVLTKAGIIDFGDCIYTNTVCEPAILMMYLMLYCEDYIQACCSVLKGYHGVYPLLEEELEVIQFVSLLKL